MVMEDFELGIDVAASAGTPLTFSDLYTAEFSSLVRLATLLTGRVEVAHDVVQDAFVRLHVRWATVRKPAAYLHRSVVNGCHSYHRSSRRFGRSDHEPTATPDVDDTLATLAGLKPKPRAMIVLKYYGGRTEREIAEILGCRPGSVGPTVQRALDTLRSMQS